VVLLSEETWSGEAGRSAVFATTTDFVAGHANAVWQLFGSV
jgi:hypothetical protein